VPITATYYTITHNIPSQRRRATLSSMTHNTSYDNTGRLIHGIQKKTTT